MADKRWKRVERDKCRELGGERTGPTGRDLPDCKDIPLIGLEVKSYKRLVFLTADWKQAVENAEKLGLIPVLAVKEAGRGGRDEVQLYDETLHFLGRLADVPPPESYRIVHMEALIGRMDWKDFMQLYRAAVQQLQEESA